MDYVETVRIEPIIAQFCNSLLLRSDRDSETEETPYTFTAKFSDGLEADIKVVNANPPYIDAVLFDQDGNELMCLDVCDGPVEGEYWFDFNDNTYIVLVEANND